MGNAGLMPATIVLFGLMTGVAWGADLYVSPAGDDSSPGTMAQPLATLGGAREAVRALREADGVRERPLVVQLRGGTYRLDGTEVFTPLDSGTAQAPVVYEAFPGEEPILSGGRLIDGWRRQKGDLWAADVPWARDLPEPFTQLFVNGQRRPRARTPNEGTYFYSKRLHMDGPPDAFPQCLGLTFREGDLGPWAGADGAVICLFHNWVNSYNRIGEADWNRRRVRFARPAGIFFLGPSVRYYIENVREALDAPGEWYLDRQAGMVYYLPPPGEDVTTAEVVAPVLEGPLVELRGEPALGLAVEHLTFRGLSFRHTEADLSADYPHSVQGAHTQRGALRAVGARECAIQGCEFTQLGEHAVSLREGCQANTIVGCHIHNVGGGGVYLSEGGPPTTDEGYLTAHNVVESNLIHDGGHLFRAGCGVFLGGSASYNRIVHNEICDLSWIGVHLGWSWTGRAPAYTHHNEVAYNHIHHLGNGVLNDIGGIYTLGVSPGTVLHHNLIHDITRFQRGEEGYGGWGIYLDAGSSEIVVENNVVYNTRDGGLHLHCFGHPYGDTIRNNVFAYSDEGQLMRNADHEPDEGLHATLERNLVYNATPRMLWGSNWAPESKFAADHNCYWSEAGEAPDFGGKTFAEWQATGRDAHSQVADPGFVDPQARDFRLRPDAPALAFGFEPIDLSSVGLKGPEALRRKAAEIAHRAFEAAPPPDPAVERLIAHDFEEYEPGEIPTHAYAGGATAIAVSDEQPAGGVRCLRLADGEAERIWEPHWLTWRTPRTGSVRLECSVRNDAQQPISMDLEFRDWPRPTGAKYATGPHLRFLPDGTVRAADGAEWRAIGRLEPGEWLEVRVEFEEGEGRPKTYTVRLGDGEPVAGLAFRSEGFRECNWIGFAGIESTPGIFYVDEVTIE